jgi:N-acetylmuramoyl-L-alanine amidase
MEIKDNLLSGDNIKSPVWSQNISGKFETNLPDTIIIHYTAGPFKASLNTLTNPTVKASAHVIVDRDGTITQLVPFDTIAWHAGKSSYQGRDGFNKYSIGIEIVNSGPLTKSGNVYRSWFGSAYNPDDVIEATHRNETSPKFWHIYTEEQIDAVTNLCRILIQQYGIKTILGHEEIAPTRKTDPGPAFPLDKMRNQLLSDARSDDGAEDKATSGRVDVSILNIRDTPKPDGAKVAMPLKKGAKVQILDEDGDWIKVRTEIEGWVFKKYIKPE